MIGKDKYLIAYLIQVGDDFLSCLNIIFYWHKDYMYEKNLLYPGHWHTPLIEIQIWNQISKTR